MELRTNPAPGLAALAALLLSIVAFGDLPLLGAVMAGIVAGLLAGLLALTPREGAVQAFGASAASVLALLLFAALGLGSPGGAPASAEGSVLVAQAALFTVLPAPLAALVARVLHPPPEKEPPEAAVGASPAGPLSSPFPPRPPPPPPAAP